MDDLELALLACDAADVISRAAFLNDDLLVEMKPDMTHVTAADKEAETAIRDLITNERPGDIVEGEEFGSSGEGRRQWIVDPIDGTANFVRGVPVWATLLALVEDAELRVAVVSAPLLDRRWHAVRGAGAFLADRRLHVSQVRQVEDAKVCFSGVKEFAKYGYLDGFLDLAKAAWRTRGYGDFWQHMLVAEGAADIAIDPVAAVWDLCACKLIVEEAGGRMTSLDGADTYAGGNGISTNSLVHDEALGFFLT